MDEWHGLWPQHLVDKLNSEGLADVQRLRELLTWSVLTALTFFLYRIARRWSGGLLAALAGRRRLTRASNLGAVLRALAQLAVLGAGPFALWGLCAEGGVWLPFEPTVAVGVLIWWLADTLDHHAVWWSRRDNVVVAQIGSGIGRIRQETWQLDRVFLPVAGGSLPPGDAPPGGAPLPVRLTQRAENDLLKRSAASREWLAKVAADKGWELQAAS